MNISLYKNRTFPVTVVKQIEKCFWTSNKYIDPYFLSILLSSVRHRNQLALEKLSIFMETFMKKNKF